MLIFKILIALILLVALFVVGVVVYAQIERRNYETLSDNKDLKDRIAKLTEPYLAKRLNGALVIGVIQNGGEHVQGFGGKSPPDRFTIYEIGSITKVFTAITLAKLVEDGRLKLDGPVSKCFPNTANIPTNITFKHLSTHSSGLPRLPANFFSVVSNSANPTSSTRRNICTNTSGRRKISKPPANRRGIPILASACWAMRSNSALTNLTRPSSAKAC